MVYIAALPDFALKTKFFSGAERKSSFDELNNAFERNFPAWGHEQMDVVWHHGKFVQLELPLRTIAAQRVEEKKRHPFRLKNGFALRATDREEIDLVSGRNEISWWLAHIPLRG
jgi:hypothetical protein